MLDPIPRKVAWYLGLVNHRLLFLWWRLGQEWMWGPVHTRWEEAPRVLLEPPGKRNALSAGRLSWDKWSPEPVWEGNPLRGSPAMWCTLSPKDVIWTPKSCYARDSSTDSFLDCYESHENYHPPHPHFKSNLNWFLSVTTKRVLNNTADDLGNSAHEWIYNRFHEYVPTWVRQDNILSPRILVMFYRI